MADLVFMVLRMYLYVYVYEFIKLNELMNFIRINVHLLPLIKFTMSFYLKTK